MTFKRGDSFDFSGAPSATLDGIPVVDFTNWVASSQIRTMSGVLIADLTITWLARNPGAIRVFYAGSTVGWPLGVAFIDIEFVTPSGTIVSTATQTLTIIEDITQ